MHVSPIPVNPFSQNFQELKNLDSDILYYFTLIWKCDNTPLKSSSIFISSLDYVNLVLKPFYEPKGVRVVCIDPINSEVTNA